MPVQSSNINNDVNQVIMLYKDEVELWYEVRLADDQIGYCKFSEVEYVDYRIRKMSFASNNKMITHEGNDLRPERHLFFGKYLKVDTSWRGHILINTHNGNVFKTDSYIHVLNDNKSMIVYKPIYEALYEDQRSPPTCE